VTFDTAKTQQMLARVGSGLSEQERSTTEEAIRELRGLAETTEDPDRLFEALKAFDRGTVRLAELAITQTLKEQDNVETSSSRMP